MEIVDAARKSAIRAMLFGTLFQELFSIIKEGYPRASEKLLDAVGKLKETSRGLGVMRDEFTQSLQPELRQIMDEIEQLHNERKKKPRTWKNLSPELQRELVFQYLLFHFCWTVLDGTVPKKKIREFDRAATSRVNAPARLRKEASRQSLAYLFSYLEEKERQQFFGYLKEKRKNKRGVSRDR